MDIWLVAGFFCKEQLTFYDMCVQRNGVHPTAIVLSKAVSRVPEFDTTRSPCKSRWLFVRQGRSPAQILGRYVLRSMSESWIVMYCMHLLHRLYCINRTTIYWSTGNYCYVNNMWSDVDVLIIPLRGKKIWKRSEVPMIALVEPDWLQYDSVDDDSEPEQVDPRAKKETESRPRSSSIPLRALAIPRSHFGQRCSYMPMVLAFMLGLGCTTLGQLFINYRRSSS